jgi:hypothetical protein
VGADDDHALALDQLSLLFGGELDLRPPAPHHRHHRPDASQSAAVPPLLNAGIIPG